MTLSRRVLFAAGFGPAAGLLARLKLAKLRIGVTDWNLRMSGKVEAVAFAKSLGFEGLEVSLGRKPVDGKLPLDNAELQAQYRAASKQHGLPIASTCLDILHVNYLKNDKLGQKWLADAIPITRRLGTRVILMPFFGKGALQTAEEKNYVADVLRELGREAEKARIALALENTISAEDNARIMERSRSKAVKVFYDVGNALNAGFEPVKEIRWLGKNRIAQIHLKDRGYLGQGKIDFAEVLRAIDEIGYEGFADLETSSPSGSVENDMRRNLAFLRDLIARLRQT